MTAMARSIALKIGAHTEILCEIQMTGLQSYLKGRLQMGIWSVCTMAGNLMGLVLASESHSWHLVQKNTKGCIHLTI